MSVRNGCCLLSEVLDMEMQMKKLKEHQIFLLTLDRGMVGEGWGGHLLGCWVGEDSKRRGNRPRG